MDPNEQKVADRVVFTPAERAVLCEQAETLKVSLDGLLASLKDGTPAETLDTWIKAHIPWDYMHELISRKITTALYDIHREERHGEG